MKLTLGSATIDLDKVASTRTVSTRILWRPVLRITFKTGNTIDVTCNVQQKRPCLISYEGTREELKMRIDRYIRGSLYEAQV